MEQSRQAACIPRFGKMKHESMARHGINGRQKLALFWIRSFWGFFEHRWSFQIYCFLSRAPLFQTINQRAGLLGL